MLLSDSQRAGAGVIDDFDGAENVTLQFEYGPRSTSVCARFARFLLALYLVAHEFSQLLTVWSV